jgi:hypothetical protein
MDRNGRSVVESLPLGGDVYLLRGMAEIHEKSRHTKRAEFFSIRILRRFVFLKSFPLTWWHPNAQQVYSIADPTTHPIKNVSTQIPGIHRRAGRFFPELASADRARAAGAVKNFVLDTNVLLHDPNCLNRFEQQPCFHSSGCATPSSDNFKNERSERGANARPAHRLLSRIFGHDSVSVTGDPTIGGGTVRILVNNFLRKAASRPQ